MYTFELNNQHKNEHPKLQSNSKIVEIFSDLTFGKDVSKHGKNTDKVMGHIKELSQRAVNGDIQAKSEINEIVRFSIAPKLASAVQLFNFMGSFRDLNYDQQPEVKTYKHDAIRSQFQASRGDVPFAATSWEKYTIGTQTISSGYAVDYREVASGNLDAVAEGMSQVQVDMINKAMAYVIDKLYNGIKNATGIKYFAETAGITKTSLDDNLKKVRRFGRPSITGDYSVVSQLNDFAGFKIDASDTKNTALPEIVMEEIQRTGLLSNYRGNSVVELPNQYNLTTKNAAGDNFETYMPEGLLFLIPQGEVAPLQIFRRGGLTSMTGNDVVTGQELTRFDMEIGADVARGLEYQIGLIRDTNYEL
jgi:hypothetical protein